MTARWIVLLAALVGALALPSTAGAADDEPLWDCTDVPFRLTPFSCFAYNTVEDNVLDRLP